MNARTKEDAGGDGNIERIEDLSLRIVVLETKVDILMTKCLASIRNSGGVN
jgi:hypothetical protein